ncbi:tetratricopeptide repeat protein [Luteitalea sp. TBR-22]|uniref:tetratricopeptide repeat protein n=1 Tax=Luteitalea sp. TBR-22 TaxID=2802971 RepID=UPI001EF3E157|nr:tetratricopeptide repeat protein [Luteitalea sp. TBR-22]
MDDDVGALRGQATGDLVTEAVGRPRDEHDPVVGAWWCGHLRPGNCRSGEDTRGSGQDHRCGAHPRIHVTTHFAQARVRPSYHPRMHVATLVTVVVGALLLMQPGATPGPARPSAVRSLRGQSLHPPDPLPNRAALERDLQQAQSVANTSTPEAIIWIGRRQAYLWRYEDAIATFTRGARLHPDDARIYRHRGHRYITTRQFALAQEDLERAAALIAGRPDEVEPDGAPNAAGVPRSTLHFNVWYHLALAYYLQAQYERAADAWAQCLRVSRNDDSVVAASDWLWISLMRLGRRGEAAQVLERITPTMEILENGAYHRRLLMYAGRERPEALLDASTADATTLATQGYGVGNYYLVTGDTQRAVAVFERVVAGTGWNAFGYIAAEADLVRMGR